MTGQEELQKKYMEIQLLNQKISQLYQQIESLGQQRSTIDSIKENLDEFGAVKKGTEILVPVANGIFVKAEVKDTHKLLVTVGSNITVEKTIPEVMEVMDNQSGEIERLQTDLSQQVEELSKKGKNIEAELHELAKV